MFFLDYIFAELRRRRGRTVLTALGLAVGVGLVIIVNGLSTGLDNAQKTVLRPLTGVGTSIAVTRPLKLPSGERQRRPGRGVRIAVARRAPAAAQRSGRRPADQLRLDQARCGGRPRHVPPRRRPDVLRLSAERPRQDPLGPVGSRLAHADRHPHLGHDPEDQHQPDADSRLHGADDRRLRPPPLGQSCVLCLRTGQRLVRRRFDQHLVAHDHRRRSDQAGARRGHAEPDHQGRVPQRRRQRLSGDRLAGLRELRQPVGRLEVDDRRQDVRCRRDRLLAARRYSQRPLRQADDAAEAFRLQRPGRHRERQRRKRRRRFVRRCGDPEEAQRRAGHDGVRPRLARQRLAGQRQEPGQQARHRARNHRADRRRADRLPADAVPLSPSACARSAR